MAKGGKAKLASATPAAKQGGQASRVLQTPASREQPGRGVKRGQSDEETSAESSSKRERVEQDEDFVVEEVRDNDDESGEYHELVGQEEIDALAGADDSEAEEADKENAGKTASRSGKGKGKAAVQGSESKYAQKKAAWRRKYAPSLVSAPSGFAISQSDYELASFGPMNYGRDIGSNPDDFSWIDGTSFRDEGHFAELQGRFVQDLTAVIEARVDQAMRFKDGDNHLAPEVVRDLKRLDVAETVRCILAAMYPSTQGALGYTVFDLSHLEDMEGFAEADLKYIGVYFAVVVKPDGSVWIYIGSAVSGKWIGFRIIGTYAKGMLYAAQGYHYSSFLGHFPGLAVQEGAKVYIRPVCLFHPQDVPTFGQDIAAQVKLVEGFMCDLLPSIDLMGSDVVIDDRVFHDQSIAAFHREAVQRRLPANCTGVNRLSPLTQGYAGSKQGVMSPAMARRQEELAEQNEKFPEIKDQCPIDKVSLVEVYKQGSGKIYSNKTGSNLMDLEAFKAAGSLPALLTIRNAQADSRATSTSARIAGGQCRLCDVQTKPQPPGMTLEVARKTFPGELAMVVDGLSETTCLPKGTITCDRCRWWVTGILRGRNSADRQKRERLNACTSVADVRAVYREVKGIDQ
ncbi:hypothetical protein LTR15_000632 [Elasticomyces elasticus]|nr:hypothetical protein LTR15_000632 [Elasticomyces elasticus]